MATCVEHLRINQVPINFLSQRVARENKELRWNSLRILQCAATGCVQKLLGKGTVCCKLLDKPGELLMQEDMYSYVTVADDQVFANQGTKIIDSQ